MSMSVRCAGCGLEYAGQPRACGGLSAGLRRRRRRATCACWPRCRASTAAARAAAAAAPGRPPAAARADARRVPGRRAATRPTSSAHFALPLVAAVWSCAPQTALALPGPLPVPVPDHHGLLVGHRLAALADRRRRLAHLRRAVAKELAAVRTGDPGHARVRRRAGRRRQVGCDDAGRRAGPSVRRGRRRHPSRPGAGAAGRPDPGRADGARRVPRTRATRRCCTPTPACCPAAGAGAASWNYPLASCARGRRPRAGQLRHEPAAAAGRPARTTWSR